MECEIGVHVDSTAGPVVEYTETKKGWGCDRNGSGDVAERGLVEGTTVVTVGFDIYIY
jgi:hypothetical protein